MTDVGARQIGMDPLELRRRDVLRKEDLPYTLPSGMVQDEVTPAETLELAAAMIDYNGFRERQTQARAEGRHLGLGISLCVEPSAIAFAVGSRLRGVLGRFCRDPEVGAGRGASRGAAALPRVGRRGRPGAERRRGDGRLRAGPVARGVGSRSHRLQDERYTRVRRIRGADPSGGATPAARFLDGHRSRRCNLYKLMAYKDEHEVARLSLDPVLDAEVEQRFGAGARYSYRLHPPVLRAIGLRRKLTLGPWFRSAFQVLRSMRRLRGTRMDLFGYAAVRRVERELIAEYARPSRAWSPA
jgi:hypothetical protein